MKAINTMTITPTDNEFFAEETIVTIIPSFTEEKIKLTFKSYGPFTAKKPMEVPLWLAIYLKNRKKCQISIPIYYTEEFLEEKVTKEKQDPSRFQVLPFQFFEIFQVLFNK